MVNNDGKGRICKYEHPVGALNHIHVPRVVQRRIFGKDCIACRIVITEGPIKAEKAAQEGLDCVALPGVWNWRQRFGDESVPIEDLSKIPWSELEEVEICFDSDAATNPNVRKAERALGACLQKHGAGNVVVVRLPADENGAKVGIDDFLRTHSMEEFENLPRTRLDDEPSLEASVTALTQQIGKTERNRVLGRIVDEEHDPSEQERLLKLAASRTRISLPAVRSSARIEAARVQSQRRQIQAAQSPPSDKEAAEAAEKQEEERRAEVERILNHAHQTVTLRAQNKLKSGGLAYVASFGDAGALFIDSSGVTPTTDLPENYRLTEPPPDKSPITGKGIQRFQSGEEIDAVGLFEAIRKFIRRRVIFTHISVPLVLALWIMASYSYSLFNYFGYVWLTSLGPGCGKSLVTKVLSLLAFNATPPLIDSTPATVFRDIEANSPTLILDELEHLDPEKKGELLSILNAGFEWDAEVRRMVRVGDQWKMRPFKVYGPKVIAGINQIPRPLQTRSFRIEMRKRKNSEKITPFRPDRLRKWSAARRDDLAIFALRNAKEIARLYANRDDLVPRQSEDGSVIFDDRLRDIFAPLYVIAKRVDDELEEPFATPELYKFLLSQAGERDAEGGGDYVIAAHALWNWAEDRWDRNGKVLIQTHEAKALFAEAEIDWAANEPAKAKSLLRKLGGRNASRWWKGKTRRGYVFSKPELQDLVERNPLSATRAGEKNREDR